ACGGGGGGGEGEGDNRSGSVADAGLEGGANDRRRVLIPPGASFSAAADSLAAAGLVGWPRLFRAYAEFRDLDREIKAGEYSFPRDASWQSMLRALNEGASAQGRVTVPEGFALREIVPLLARSLGAPADSLDAAVRDSALLARLDIPTPTLEGYLFPDTYHFPFGTSARTAVREMVRRFEAVWDPAWEERLQQLGMSRHEVISLASIIEKEARLDSERALISAVYHNRLKRGMPLQADPTVQYALGRHKDRVMYRDLTVNSPYNTYRNRGLPPGPIASPGRASLEAALRPANVPYLFFVAHPDGHHEFRTTFKEHTEAREKVRRAGGR
ncbi:MAG: endolytic transglycosylase MltG, partial [Gemmatimonadaceae bacterium]